MTAESRKEFESWLFSKDGANSTKVSEKYLTREQRLMWEAWQASRTKPIVLPIIYTVDGCQYYYKTDIQEAIEAAGYTYE